MAMLNIPMAFNQSCYGLRAKKDIVDSTFLYYLVKYCVRLLKRITHGSVFDTITRETFESIQVDIPEMKTQLKMGRLLASLDDKIELNKKINDNLAA
jgi:type I restriction enzyme S subunit